MAPTTDCAVLDKEVILLNEKEDVLGDSGGFSEEGLETVENGMIDYDSGSDEQSEGVADDLQTNRFEMEFSMKMPLNAIDTDINIEATVRIDKLGSETCRWNEDSTKDNADGLNTGFSLFWSGQMDVEQQEGENENDLVSESEYGVDADRGAGPPADALFFALGYLGLKDLLTVETVCKPLREAVQNDPLLWRNICIGVGVNSNLTDDILMRLTNRAQGSLNSLTLERCSSKITNNCIKKVLENNLRLSKLNVAGCMGIRAEQFLRDLKAFSSIAKPGIQRLRIDQLPDMTNELFEEFLVLLGVDKAESVNNYKPKFYIIPKSDFPTYRFLSLDDESPIDVEVCPMCDQVMQVFSCPTKKCQVEPQNCRGCLSCIDRCLVCGCCFKGGEAYDEPFPYTSLCKECFSLSA